jgi:zinc protease
MKRSILLVIPFFLAFATHIERDTLDNGLVVLTVEAHKIPVVEMKAYVRAGSAFDPSGKEGLANLVGQMLIRGTESFSYDEITASIESVGGVLTPFTSEDYSGMNGKVLSKDLPRIISIMAECLQYPSLDSLELFRLKRETISYIRAQSDDPFVVCEKGFRNLLFGDHPLSHLPVGTDSSVASVIESDVRSYHGTYFHPNNTFLVFIGDFSKDSLVILLNETFGKWVRSELHNMDLQPPRVSDYSLGHIIPMDVSQAYVMLGNFGPEYGAGDWHAVRVMNYILGGAGLTARISTTIREEKGLAYIAYSYFKRFVNGGYFAAEVQTKKEMVGEAVQSLIAEIEGMKEEIHTEEIDRAKKFYTGYLPLFYDTFGEMAEIVAQVEIAGYGLDYLEHFEEYITSLTLDELKAAAQKYLHPEQFYLLIVGDVQPEDVNVEGIEWLQ